MPLNNGPAVGALFIQTSTVTIFNTGSDTSLVGSGVGSMTTPVNFFTPGKTLRLRAIGIVSDTANPNYTFNVKINGTTVATSTKAFTGTVSNDTFVVDVVITCFTTGVGGTAWVQGAFGIDASTFNFNGLATTTTTALDTTIANTFDISFQWGTPPLRIRSRALILRLRRWEYRREHAT